MTKIVIKHSELRELDDASMEIINDYLKKNHNEEMTCSKEGCNIKECKNKVTRECIYEATIEGIDKEQFIKVVKDQGWRLFYRGTVILTIDDKPYFIKES